MIPKKCTNTTAVVNQNATQMELLAPAGGMDQLKAAIRFGADAVYLAAKRFGMRARAANFAMEEIPKAVEFAHSCGAKVYVTCNVLIHESNLAQLPEYFTNLAQAGVDAFIIGDMGAATIAADVTPDVALHVSTQASVANSAAAKAWAKLGAKRVVLAREMSLEDILAMKKELAKSSNPAVGDLELEAFVHGAMCMSVSGRCLISSYLTGRSANKGHCTQPCRWGYNLQEEKRPGQDFYMEEDNFGTYIMNSKDLNMLAYLDKLAQAGVTSIKIEGRNKKALYVATVVNAYRHVLDALHDSNLQDFQAAVEQWAPQLETVSHRPYSTGFYFGKAEQSPDYDGYEQNRIHAGDVVGVEQAENAENAENAKNTENAGSADNATNAKDVASFDNSKGTNNTETADNAALRHLYKVSVLCRNHFENDEVLEALVPGKNVVPVKVCNLKLNKKPVEVANRATEIYTFETDEQLCEGSYLRSIAFLRTARSAGKLAEKEHQTTDK